VKLPILGQISLQFGFFPVKLPIIG